MQKNLKALHIRFMSEGEQEMNISSREFIKKAEFVNVETLTGSQTGEESGGSGSGSGSSSGSGSGSGSNTGGGGDNGGGTDDYD